MFGSWTGTATYQYHHSLCIIIPQKFSCCYSIYNPKKTNCALSKQGQRFLTSIAALPLFVDPNRFIHKFVSSSSKSVTLTTLNHLLSLHSSAHSRHCSLLLPFYMNVTQLSWFSWNSKLVTSVIAFLHKQGQLEEAELLISESVSNFCPKERDLVSFYCNLINCHAQLKSEDGFSTTFRHLKERFSRSSSTYVRKRAYESMVGGLCVMGRPHEGRKLIDEMRELGIKPSIYEFRSIIEGYGRSGQFKEMQESIADMESSGMALDRISSNMVLLSYGLHNELGEMIEWLKRIKKLGIGSSIRTCNSVLNSCPTMTSLLEDLKSVPLSLKQLLVVLKGDEALLVQELGESLFLDEIITWSPSESKLDLHGMHLSTAYLIILLWMEELKRKFSSRECNNIKVPTEVIVICGVGKHSSIRGESPVKALFKQLMLRTKSPMRVDRKNIGCFIAKGKTVKDWLLPNH